MFTYTHVIIAISVTKRFIIDTIQVAFQLSESIFLISVKFNQNYSMDKKWVMRHSTYLKHFLMKTGDHIYCCLELDFILEVFGDFPTNEHFFNK